MSKKVSRMHEALKNAGLYCGSVWSTVIGKVFTFECEYGSHFQILQGIITGVSLSDEGGLQLFVSIPRLGSSPLKSLIHDGGQWQALLDIEITPEDFEKDGEDALDKKFLLGKLSVLG